MAKKKAYKPKQFMVGYRINVWLEQAVIADTFEDALTIAKDRTAENILCDKFDIQDSNAKVVQVYAEEGFETSFN